MTPQTRISQEATIIMARVISEHYKRHENIIHALAHKYLWATRFVNNYDDLVAEGNAVYSACLHTYDQSYKVKFSSYLYGCCKRHFQSLAKKAQAQKRAAMQSVPLEDVEGMLFYTEDNSRGEAWRTFLESLNDNEKEIVHLVLHDHKKLLKYRTRKDDSGYATRITKQQITKYMREKGKRPVEISCSFVGIGNKLRRAQS